MKYLRQASYAPLEQCLDWSRLKLNSMSHIKVDVHDADIEDAWVDIGEVNLSHNSIKAWDMPMLMCMSSLTVLNLQHNLLEFVPLQLTALVTLSRLDVSKNRIQRLRHQIADMELEQLRAQLRELIAPSRA